MILVCIGWSLHVVVLYDRFFEYIVLNHL